VSDSSKHGEELSGFIRGGGEIFGNHFLHRNSATYS
jgi:hypothetical protein